MTTPLLTTADTKDPQEEFPFAPAEYIFHLLLVISRYRDAHLEKILRATGLSATRYRALLVIQRFGPCSMGEVAEFSVVERTTMTRTVDQLVEAGLVQRLSRGADRRQVTLIVTEAGRSLAMQSAALILSQNRNQLEGISDEDQRVLVRLCQGLLANLTPDSEARRRMLTFQRA